MEGRTETLSYVLLPWYSGGSGRERDMNKSKQTASAMTKWITVVTLVGVLMLAVGMLLFNLGVLGLSETNVMAQVKLELEQSGADPAEYQYMTAQDERLYAVLAYRENRAENRYFLFVNRPGFSFGWFYDRSDTVGDDMTLVEVEDAGAVWLSANADGEIATVTYADGASRALGGYPLVETARELHLFNADGEEITELRRPG